VRILVFCSPASVKPVVPEADRSSDRRRLSPESLRNCDLSWGDYRPAGWTL